MSKRRNRHPEVEMYEAVLRVGKSQETQVAARPAVSHDGAAVDLVHLSRYTLSDPALEREVLGLFLAQLPLTIESLKFADNDQMWRMAAHTLKGSARTIGAWTLSMLAQQAEKLGGKGDRDASDQILQKIESAAAEVETYIKAVVAGTVR